MTDLRKLLLRGFISACTLFALSSEVLAEGRGRSGQPAGPKMRMDRPGQARGMQHNHRGPRRRERMHRRMNRRMDKRMERQAERGPRDFSQGHQRPPMMDRFSKRPPIMKREGFKGRREFQKERLQDRKDFKQERFGDRRDFKQDKRENKRDFRQGEISKEEFANTRKEDRKDFRQDRRLDKKDFRQERLGDRKEFREERGPRKRRFKRRPKRREPASNEAGEAPMADNNVVPEVDVNVDTSVEVEDTTKY
jgi:hypothetical protein